MLSLESSQSEDCKSFLAWPNSNFTFLTKLAACTASLGRLRKQTILTGRLKVHQNLGCQQPTFRKVLRLQSWCICCPIQHAGQILMNRPLLTLAAVDIFTSIVLRATCYNFTCFSLVPISQVSGFTLCILCFSHLHALITGFISPRGYTTGS